MKKTAHSLALVFGLLAVFFIALPAHANTIYQQLSDSSKEHTTDTNFCNYMGSFTLASTTNFVVGDAGLVVGSINNTSLHATGVYLALATSKGNSGCVGWGTVVGQYNSELFDGATSTGDLFMTMTVTTAFSLNAGTYYLYMGGLNVANTNWKILMNFSEDFVYGYLTANGTGTSFPISPGLPGFTDYGIATSSQAVYCYQNFASSTGFLDSVGLSISQGFCNVGVFLFVPNSGVLNNFSSLIPVAQTKIPFSYFYDISSIVNGSTASSTQNMTAFSINLAGLDFASSTGMGPILPTGNFDFLSSTTISHFLPVGMHDLLYNMMIAAIWVDVAWLFYRKIVPAKAKI